MQRWPNIVTNAVLVYMFCKKVVYLHIKSGGLQTIKLLDED